MNSVDPLRAKGARLPRIAGAIASSLIASAGICNSADIAHNVVQHEGQTVEYLSLSGEISDTDDVVFSRTLKAHPRTVFVMLESLGGQVLPALKIGEEIHANNLATAAVGVCASACGYA